MQEKSLIKKNILRYLEFKGITRYQFYKETGMTRGILDQNNGITEENIYKFLDYAKDVSIDWLLLNKGNMLDKISESTINKDDCTDIGLLQILNERENKIDELNRLVGKYEYQLLEMKKKFKRLKKGEYSTKTIPHSVAAEDDLKYIQNKKGNTHTHKTR